MKMNRRRFIKTTARTLSIPLLLHGVGVSAFAHPAFHSPVGEENDRVLVLIRLTGGNDGLNTLIPLDQYSNLFRARSNILIPENKVLRISDDLGFHPVMKGIRSLHDEGKVGIIQSAGYPSQNRSHFRSSEVWMSGSPADQFWLTGWLGRYLEDRFPGYPDEYPNTRFPDPFAVSMGYFTSETCQGKAANFSFALNDPFSLAELPDHGNQDPPNLHFREELKFVRSTVSQTNRYGGRILEVSKKGKNTVGYPETDLGRQLRNVALLLSGGLRSKVYIVSLGGFDTHANQAADGNPTAGRHATLLTALSDAVSAFQEDLENLGLESRVLSLTFSEFGRQIRSNGAFGTDHGDAAPLFLFGTCVNPAILGSNPEIGYDTMPQEALPMQFDFRDVYGTILSRWFNYPETSVREIFGREFQALPLIAGCE